jgi:hypothetical protein
MSLTPLACVRESLCVSVSVICLFRIVIKTVARHHARRGASLLPCQARMQAGLCSDAQIGHRLGIVRYDLGKAVLFLMSQGSVELDSECCAYKRSIRGGASENYPSCQLGQLSSLTAQNDRHLPRPPVVS